MSHNYDDTLSGPTLCGFSDYFSDEDCIGAAPGKKSAAPTKRPLPPPPSKAATSGKSMASKNTIYGPAKTPKPSAVPKQHATVIKAAKSTAAKVVQAAMHAANAAKSTPKKPTVLAKKPSPGMPAMKALVGVTGPSQQLQAQQPKPLTPKAKSALEKQKNAATKSGAAAKKAATAALNAKKAAIALAKAAKTQKATSIGIRKKKGKTTVRGIDLMGMNTEIGEVVREIFDEYYTTVGAAPDPNNPGFLDDGSPDPAFFGDPSQMDTGAGLPSDAMNLDLGGSDVLEQDLGPPLPPDARIRDMNAVGGIPYDGSRPQPPGWIGSASYFYKTIVNPKYAERQYGFVYGGDPHKPEWPGDKFDKWVWVHGKKGDSGSIPDFPGQESGVSGWWDTAENVNPSYNTIANVHQASISKGYGVIMGNPAFPDFTGLRCDDAGNLFWMPQEAPDWLMAPLKAAAEQTAKAEREAAAAAQAAQQAAMDKINSDAALAKAQQDAADALAESHAASEQNIAQAQMDTQSQQMDLQQAQAEQQQSQQQSQLEFQQTQMEQQQQAQIAPLMIQQAQMEQQQQMADMQAAQQAQQMLMDQARSEMEYYQQHPEVAVGPVPEQEVPGPIEDADQGESDEVYGDEGEDGGGVGDDYDDRGGAMKDSDGGFYEDGMES